MSKQARRRWFTKINRELVGYTFGLGLFTLTGLGWVPAQPALYPFYAGMMSLGSVLRYAENKQRERDKDRDR